MRCAWPETDAATARHRLAELFSRFDEGADTADLRFAQKLLDELA